MTEEEQKERKKEVRDAMTRLKVARLEVRVKDIEEALHSLCTMLGVIDKETL